MSDITADIVDTMRQPVLVLDRTRRVLLANRAFCALFEVSVNETVGVPLRDLGNGQWNIPELIGKLDEVSADRTEIRDYRLEHEFPELGRRVMLLNARFMEAPNEGDRILVAIEDVTERERILWELEGQKEFAEKIVDASREALLILDWDLRVKTANETFYDVFQVSAEETEGRLVYELGHGEWDIPELRELLEDVLPDNHSFDDFEVRNEFPRIGHRHMLLNARRLDHTQNILLAIEDVTERERSARALRGSEARLTAMLNHAPIGIGVIDREGRWIYKNPEIAPVVGDRLPSRDPDLQPPWRGFGEDGAPLPPSEWPGARALRGETVAPGIDFRTDAPNEERWFRVAAAPIVKNGEIEEAVVILEDVTERVSIAERLRESEARLSAAMKAGRLGVFDYDPRSGRIEWDPTVRALWGVAADEEITYETFVAGVHDEDVPWVENAVAKAFDPAGDGLYEAEYRVVHRETGEVRWVKADGSAEFSDGTPVRLVGTVADVTARKRAEQESELLTRELSHRVKNTLAVVQSLARMTNGRHRSVDAYRDAFLGRLQALARAHSLLLDENWERTDLRELIELTVRAFEVDSPEMTILEGDSVDVTAKQAMGLSLVLHELGTNAVKYGSLSEHGGKLRIAWGVEEGEHGPVVRLTWKEREGPPVTPPESHGFGTRMIQETCSYELDGEARLDFAREGFTCTIVFALE